MKVQFKLRVNAENNTTGNHLSVWITAYGTMPEAPRAGQIIQIHPAVHEEPSDCKVVDFRWKMKSGSITPFVELDEWLIGDDEDFVSAWYENPDDEPTDENLEIWLIKTAKSIAAEFKDAEITAVSIYKPTI